MHEDQHDSQQVSRTEIIRSVTTMESSRRLVEIDAPFFYTASKFTSYRVTERALALGSESPPLG